MRHELASERLLELAYGELSPGEAREVESHVAGCERCREELAAIGETRSLMAGLPVEPAPERGERVILAAARVEAEARSATRPSLLPPWLWAGSIGAMAAAVVAVVSWQLTREPIRPSLRQDSELMGSARPAAPPAAAPVQRPVEQPTVAMKEEAPAKREPMAKAVAAPRPPAEEAKGPVAGGGAIGIVGAQGSPLSPAPAGERPGDGAAPESRALLATSRADNARGAAGYAMADAEKAAPAPVPESLAMADKAAPAPAKARPSAPAANGTAVKAARADDEAEGRRLALARSDERKAAAKAATALRPRQAPGTVEVRKFPSCPGERRRVIEYASDGSLLRYLREGEVRSVEQLFDPDGRLVAAFAIERAVRRPLPLDTPGLAQDAGEVWIDAPPRCEP